MVVAMSRARAIPLATLATLAVGAIAAGQASAAVGWFDGSQQYHSTVNCSGLVGYHGSTVGQYRDAASAAYPVPGDRYYGRISIGAGPTCLGTDAFRYFVRPPTGTQYDPGSDADGRVRCWYNTNPTNASSPWIEITDPTTCIEPVAAANGYWDLGKVTLGVGWGFEVHFPLRSSQTLNGDTMIANVFSGAGGPNAMIPTVGVTVYGAPVTSITSAGPPATTNSTSASFSFSANKQVQGFQCALDGASFSGCSSPRVFNGLANGQHTFHVRAISQGGTAAAETTRTWTVDTVGPTTTINSGPSGPTQQNSASFGFTSSEGGSTFQCSLDSGAFTGCTSPQGYSGLSNGPHTFQVRATDGVGNLGSPATRAWTVDTTGASVPPTTTITSGPPQTGTTSETTATLEFTSSKPSSTFECKLDSGSFAACTSPKAFSGLPDGAHTFEVRATSGGLLGNTATWQWTVLTGGPTGSGSGGQGSGDPGSGGQGSGDPGSGGQGSGDPGSGDPGSGDQASSAACDEARAKVASAKEKLKKAKKSGNRSKIKKAKKRLKSAQAAMQEACA
jgi:hypothetical protein